MLVLGHAALPNTKLRSSCFQPFFVIRPPLNVLYLLNSIKWTLCIRTAVTKPGGGALRRSWERPSKAFESLEADLARSKALGPRVCPSHWVIYRPRDTRPSGVCSKSIWETTLSIIQVSSFMISEGSDKGCSRQVGDLFEYAFTSKGT